MAENSGDVPNFGFGKDGKLPTTEELLAALDSMDGLSEENKQELKESILRGAFSREAEKIVGANAEHVASGDGGQLIFLLLMISLVFLIILFFGYKLYSSLMEKEKRREEKRKLKQQKKKK